MVGLKKGKQQNTQAILEALQQKSVEAKKTTQKLHQTGQISKDYLSVANTSQNLIQQTLSTQSKPLLLSGSPKQSLKYSSPTWNQYSTSSSTKSNTTEALSSSSTGSKKSSSIEDEDYDYTSAINNTINNSTTEEENTSSTEVGAPGLPSIIGETMTTLAEVLAALSLLTELQGQLAAKESELEGTITAKDVQNVEDNLKAADTTMNKQLKKMSEEIDKARTMKIVMPVLEAVIGVILFAAGCLTGNPMLAIAGIMLMVTAATTASNCFGPNGAFTKLLESMGIPPDTAQIISAVFNMTLTIATAVFMTLAMPGIGAGMAAVMITAGVLGGLASSNLIGVCMNARTDSTSSNKEEAYEKRQQNAETSENINKWLGYASLGLSIATIVVSFRTALVNMMKSAMNAVSQAIQKTLETIENITKNVLEAIQSSLTEATATAETAGTATEAMETTATTTETTTEEVVEEAAEKSSQLLTNATNTAVNQGQSTIQNASGNVEEVSSKVKDTSTEVSKAEESQSIIAGTNDNVTSMVQQMNQLSESFTELQDAANEVKKAAQKILEELEQTGQSLQEQINKVKELLENPSGTVAEGQTAGASEELSQAVEKLNKMTSASEQQLNELKGMSEDLSKTVEDVSKNLKEIKNSDKFSDLKPEEISHLKNIQLKLLEAELERLDFALTKTFSNYTSAGIAVESLTNTAETAGKLESTGKSSTDAPSTPLEEATQGRDTNTLQEEAENESDKITKEAVSQQKTSTNEAVLESSTKAPTDTEAPTTDTSSTEAPTEKTSPSSRFENNPIARAYRKYITEGVKSPYLKPAEEMTTNEMKNLDQIINGEIEPSQNFEEAYRITTGEKFLKETEMTSEELTKLKGPNGKTFQQNLQELNEQTVAYRKALQKTQAEFTQVVKEGPSEAEEFITKQYKQSLLEKGTTPEMANLEESAGAGYEEFKEDFIREMETDPESIQSPPTSETGKSITQRFNEWLMQKGDETFELRKQMVESLAFIVQGIGGGVEAIAQGAMTIQQAEIEAKVKELGAQLELLEVERDILFMYMDMSSKELTQIESNYENWTSTVDQIYSSLNTMANQAV
jgi:hypothetical protein